MSRFGACSARISGDRHTDTQTHRPSTVTLAAHAHRGLMKSTEVQNPRLKYCMHLAYYANVRAQKLATPRVVAERLVPSVLAPTRAIGINRHSFGQG